MNLLRVQATTLVTLTQTFRVDGDLTDCAGAVTATVKRLDGTQISGSPFTATHGTVGVYTFQLPARTQVDMLTVDWAGSLAGANVVIRDYADIVGGFYFGIDEAREVLKTIIARNPLAYTASSIAAKRTAVEQECDAISGRAWVPRFARFAVDGSGMPEILVPDLFVRTVRAVSIVESDGSLTAYTAGQLARIQGNRSGSIVRLDGDSWPLGTNNIIVEYEHGLDMPTIEIHDATLQRLRSSVNHTNPTIPDRVLSYTTDTGAVFRLQPATPRSTGIDTIDAAYKRQSTARKFWIAS